MRKTTAKRLGMIAGGCVLLVAGVALVPGFQFRGEIPGVIGVCKSSSEGRQSFSVSLGECVVKYDFSYGAVVLNSCVGPEGFSLKAKGYPYFRKGGLELQAWRDP